MKPEDLDDHTPIEPDNELLTRVHSRSASFRRRRTAQRLATALVGLVVIALAGGVAWARVDSTDTHVSSPGTSASTTTTTESELPAGSIVGTWHPVSIAGYDGPLTAPPLGYAPLLRFERVGKWSGSDGCNDLGGTYRLGTDGSFHFVTNDSTAVLCVQPYPKFDTIETATRIELRDDHLTLLDNGGKELAEFSRNGPSVPTTACTSDDLNHTGDVAMPTPVRLAQARVYDHGNIHLDPPAAGASPSASPSVIWKGSSTFKSPVGTYELVLADYSSLTPSTGGVPEFQHVLAWVVIGRHVPATPTGGPGRVPQSPCQFVTVVDAYNAKTGEGMVQTEGGI